VININIDNIIKSDPLFWTDIRSEILQEILNHVQVSDNKWSEKKTQNIIDILSNAKSTKAIHPELIKIEIANILEFCELEGYIELNIILKKKFRPSILDFPPSSFSKYDDVNKMVLFLWKHWFIPGFSKDDLLFPFLFSLSSDAGYRKPLLSSIPLNLRLCDITSKHTLLIPISEKDSSIFCCELFIPCSTSLILSTLLREHKNDNPTSFIFFPTQTDMAKRKKHLNDKLKEQYRKFADKFMDSTHIVAATQGEFFRLAPLRLLKHAVPPFLLSLQSAFPTQVTGRWSDYSSFLFNKKIKIPVQLNEMIIKTVRIGEGTDLLSNSTILSSNDTPIKVKDWQNKANTILQQLIIDLDSLNVKVFNRDNIKLKTSKIFCNNLKKADTIAIDGSALHLAIKWTEHLINNNVNSTNTLGIYYSQIFTDRLFAYPDAYKFKELTTQDHNKIFSQILLNCSATPNTIKKITDLWFRVYDFAYSIKYVDNITFIHTISNLNLLRRFALVWLYEFDAKISPYRNDERYAVRVLVLFEEILYYTGLRESECYSLKIEDIVISEATCDIIVREGKTNNAIRIVPLHVLAPESIVVRFMEYIQLRKNIKGCYNKMHLFGPEDKAEQYDYHSLMRNLSNLVKNQFGKYFVPHLLRHSFQSLLVLRNIAIDLPDVINELPDKNNEMFSSAKIEELKNWIYDSNLDERGIIGKENTSLWQISKLMGHSNPSQGLYTYDHSFPFYQKLYLAKVDKALGQKHKLSQGAAELLIPKMKSAQTRAKKLNKDSILNDFFDDAWAFID
jgi:site-specific recombinase XerD